MSINERFVRRKEMLFPNSTDVLRGLGGEVIAGLYPDVGHTINRDEFDTVTDLMASMLGQTEDS